MKSELFKILFEDNHLIVIDKHSGVLSIPDRFNRSAPNVYSVLKKKYDQIFVVHRLDKDTSGVMIFAKDADSHRKLNMDFESNQVRRIYHTVVEGIVMKDEFEIDIPLRDSKRKLGITVPSVKGKPSLTLVKVLERFRNQSLLECELKTGRHHQIRVHLQTIGHPLLVDELYGKNSEFMLSFVKPRVNLKKGTEELPIISRLTLHSHTLEFTHPTTNQRMSFTANYQKDFSALLQILRKYSK